ncbi:hypothetical protein WP1_165 [Pseudomonas phage WP1]
MLTYLRSPTLGLIELRLSLSKPSTDQPVSRRYLRPCGSTWKFFVRRNRT